MIKDFAEELAALVEKHRDIPGADLESIMTALNNESSKLYFELLERGEIKLFPEGMFP